MSKAGKVNQEIPDNQNLMTRLADIVSGPDTSELIIHGEEGSGKSFLMQAVQIISRICTQYKASRTEIEIR